MIRTGLAIALILALAGVAPSCSSSWEPATSPSTKVREFLGDDAVAILEHADRVECFRVEASAGKHDPVPLATKQVSGYPVTATGVTQGGAFATRLARILYDEATYDFRSSKKCEFEPGVA